MTAPNVTFRTERTYVKQLQELVEIYIKPAAIPVNLLSGVSSRQESVVPAGERKVVFGGIDALFSFHHESFLPALEKAASPLYKPNFQESDPDGKMSLDVAKAVGDIFVKHAAFMRMYSSYIKYVTIFLISSLPFTDHHVIQQL